MKDKRKKLMLLILMVIFVSVSFGGVYAINNKTVVYLDREIWQPRLEKADELPLEERNSCVLPTPGVTGYPYDMDAYTDTTNAEACISDHGVEAIAWSDWPGSSTDPLQHFNSKWWLIDVKTEEVLLYLEDNSIDEPYPNNPPSSFIGWMKHCGDSREILLLLDVYAHQVTPTGEIGLTLKDYSWHFTLPAVACKVHLPIIYNEHPTQIPTPTPTPNPTPTPTPTPLTCPDTWYTRHAMPNEPEEQLNYTAGGDNLSRVLQLWEGQTYYLTTRKKLDDTIQLIPNSEITIWDESGNLWLELNGPEETLIGGKDLLWQTYSVESSFLVYRNEESLRCWNWVRVYDPPLLRSNLMDKYNLSYEEADELMDIYISKLSVLPHPSNPDFDQKYQGFESEVFVEAQRIKNK